MSQWNIFGHEWASEKLQSSIIHGRIGHAYLITGPAQVGKTTLAIKFAQALNCTSDYLNNRPCGTCRSCQLIASGRHPDVRIIEPELNSRGQPSIKIDQMRELQRELNLGTYEARHKVAVITQFDSATIGAANAFLKTLEEPPADVVLILTASESDALLPTINSRCRTMALRPLSVSQVSYALETHWHTPTATAQLLGHLSNGRLGWAVQAAADETILQTRQEQISLLNEALNGRRVERFVMADKLSRKPEVLSDILQTWLGWWRDLTVLSNGQTAAEALINIDQKEQFDQLLGRWDSKQILHGLNKTNEALWQLERNVNVRLMMENLFLNYPLVGQS
ncbi:MAG: DNA polymerase III subunit delta' [Anaerolineales bacterium]|nr:DNA polymerase III subunit delta' [Anaerolineales bacterium]